jgi:hypothetical protein
MVDKFVRDLDNETATETATPPPPTTTTTTNIPPTAVTSESSSKPETKAKTDMLNLILETAKPLITAENKEDNKMEKTVKIGEDLFS